MPNTTRKPTTRKGTVGREPTFGETIISRMQKLVDTLQAGGMAAVEKKFTVHRVRRTVFEKPTLTAADVAAIRADLGVSPAVFAALLGVSPNTVRAWEQGANTPSGLAVR